MSYTLGRRTLYDVLGIPPSSSRQEVKAQFYKLSLLYHPDRPDPSHSTTWRHEKFIQISQAYSILSDERQRQVYDRENNIGFNPSGLQTASNVENMSFWNPHIGFRRKHRHHYQPGKEWPIRERVDDTLSQNIHSVNKWTRWSKLSKVELDRMELLRRTSENAHREETLIRRRRFILFCIIVGVYIATTYKT